MKTVRLFAISVAAVVAATATIAPDIADRFSTAQETRAVASGATGIVEHSALTEEIDQPDAGNEWG